MNCPRCTIRRATIRHKTTRDLMCIWCANDQQPPPLVAGGAEHASWPVGHPKQQGTFA